MDSKDCDYCVSVYFDDLLKARSACELLSVAFPMLTFELSALPRIDLSSYKDFYTGEFSVNNSLPNISFNEYLKEHFEKK